MTRYWPLTSVLACCCLTLFHTSPVLPLHITTLDSINGASQYQGASREWLNMSLSSLTGDDGGTGGGGNEGDPEGSADDEGTEGDVEGSADDEGTEGDVEGSADDEGTEGDPEGSADDEGTEGDDGGSGDGDVEGSGGGVGVLGVALGSLWDKVRPYIMQRTTTTQLTDRLDTFKKQLLTKAEDLVSLYTKPTSVHLPGRRADQTSWSAGLEEVVAAHMDDDGQRRMKREHPIALPLFRDPDGVWLLQDIKGRTSLPLNGSLMVNMMMWQDRPLVAIIDVDLILSLYFLDHDTHQAKLVLTLPGNVNCQLVQLSLNQLLMVCITRDDSHLDKFYWGVEEQATQVKVYLVEQMQGWEHLTLSTLQVIHTDHPIDVRVWLQKEQWCMIVANAMSVTKDRRHLTSTTYHTTSRFYHWTGQYFDVVHELPGTYPVAVLYFKVKTWQFIALANFLNNKGQHNCYSNIFRYSLDLERYVPFQQVFTKGARHFEHFTLGSGHHRHNFLAVANFCEDDIDGRCNPYTMSSIYRYQFGKFTLFQEIPTVNAVQWLAIQVGEGVVLAVANVLTGVKFYQYTGWRFVPTTVQHTSGPFSAGVTSMAAITWGDTIIMGVSNQNADYSSPSVPTLYNLSFRRERTIQDFHERLEYWCKERLAKLEKNTNQINLLRQQIQAAPKVNDEYITFSELVTIKGNLTVMGKSRANQVYVRGKEKWIPERWWEQKLESLKVEEDLGEARRKLEATIPLVGPVTWPANLYFTNLDARTTSSMSSVVDLVAAQVNNHVLDDDLVRLFGSSNIQLKRFSMKYVEVQSKALVARLMNRPMTDYVTLGGRHTIKGTVTFPLGLSASHITSGGTVDGISVSQDSLLLTNTRQTHTGWVRCDSLEAAALHVDTINKVKISLLFPSLVTRDAPATITGHLIIEGDLLYREDLRVNMISNLDLHNPLRTDEPGTQVITGEHRVGGVRTPTVRVGGKVNNVRVPEEVFLRHSNLSYTMSSASFTHLLADSLTIATALDTITVSDGQLDVLRVTGSQTVMSYKRFSSIRLLQQHSSTSYSSTYSRRRRRETGSGGATCGFLVGCGLTEGETRREALLLSLRSVIFAQDLLTFLADVHPSRRTLPQQSVHLFTRLTEDVPCAFSEIDNQDEGLMLFNVHTLAQGKEENQTGVELLKEDINTIVNNVEKYKLDLDEGVGNHELTWHDVFMMLINARMLIHLSAERDLVALDSVILALDGDQKEEDSQPDHEQCKPVCPDVSSQNSSLLDHPAHRCLPGFTYITNILKRISEYPLVINLMTRLSVNQRQLLQMAVVEHSIKRLLEVIREEEQLREDIRVAILCRTSTESRNDVGKIVKMLKSYKQELTEEGSPVLGRTRRAAVAVDYRWEAGEYDWTGSVFSCTDIPQHYRQDVNSVRTKMTQIRVAFQILQKVNSTKPWHLKTFTSVTEEEFESYFLNHTYQVKVIVQGLLNDTIKTLNNFNENTWSTRAEYFIDLVTYAVRFHAPLSVMVRNELDHLSGLLQVCMGRLKKVMNCFMQIMREMEATRITNEADPTTHLRPPLLPPTTPSSPTYRSKTENPSPRAGTKPVSPAGTYKTPGSWVTGMVGGFILQELAQFYSALSFASNNHMQYIVTHMDKIRNIVFRRGVNVSRVNGVDMERLRLHALALIAPTLPPSITFTQPVLVSGGLVVKRINQVEASHYVTLSGHHVFPQPITFTDDVVVRGQVKVRSTVNNIDLVAFKSIVALISSSGAQVFLTPVTFMNVSSLRVECEVGRVAGVFLDDLVLLNETAVISGEKRFLEVGVREGEVQVGDLQVDLINGINVTALFHDSLRKNPGGVQVLTGAMKLEKLVVLKGLTTQDFRTSTGQVFSLPSVAGRVVYLDQLATITGGLLFQGAISISSLTFLDTFDAVPATTYSDGWLLATSDQVIAGQLVLASMTSGDATAAPGVKIQGVDIIDLLTSNIHVYEPSIVHVPLRFGEVYASWVKVAGLVQGWDLSEDAILQGSPNIVFTSLKIFRASVTITGSFRAASGLSGVDSDKSCSHLEFDKLLIKGTVSFKRNVTTGMVHLEHHIITGESLNDYWMEDRDTALQESLKMNHVEARHVTATKVNGMELMGLSTQVLRKTCSGSQVLSGFYHMEFLSVNSLYTGGVQTKILNGRPVSDLLNIFTVSGSQVIPDHWSVGTVHVAGDLLTSGLVNGMRMTQFCLVGKTCVVKATKNFSQDLVVNGDHIVRYGRKVQGVDVSEAFKSAVSRTSCGRIPGTTIFTTSVSVVPGVSAVVGGTVDGVKVTLAHLLTHSGTQVMRGRLAIRKPDEVCLWAPSLSAKDGLFNKKNLTRLLEQTFRLGRINNVWYPVNFNNDVTFRNASYTSVIWLLVQMAEDLSSVWLYERAFLYLQSISSFLSWAVMGRVHEFWGWRLVQEFEQIPLKIIPLRMDWTESGSVDGTVALSSKYLALITRLGDTKILEYSSSTEQYHDFGVVIPGNCTRSVVGYERQQQTFIVTGHVCHYEDPGQTLTSAGTQDVGDEWVRVYRLGARGRPSLVTTFPTPGAVDVQVMWWLGEVCLVVVEARGTDTVVACEDPTTRQFLERQRLPSVNPRKASVAKHTDPTGLHCTFLAVADSGDSPERKGAFYIWRSDHHSYTTTSFILLQELDLRSVIWVELISHYTDLFLVVVSEAFRGDQEGAVNIYRMDWFSEDGTTPLGHFGTVMQNPSGNTSTFLLQGYQPQPKFYLVQGLAVYQPKEARFSVLSSGELVLYIVNEQGFVSRFFQKGIHRFWEEGELHAHKRQTMEAWVMERNGRRVHRISVAGERCAGFENEQQDEPARVLEAIYRGGELVNMMAYNEAVF